MTREDFRPYFGEDEDIAKYVLWRMSDDDIDECPIPEKLVNEMSRHSEGGLKHDERFLEKSSKPCYIPDLGQECGSVYNYQDLRDEVEMWAEGDGLSYMALHPWHNVDSITELMYDCLTWTYPSTWLNELQYSI